MGRYYEGDIEGKFMFAVQSSDDGEFFGAQEETNYVHYWIDDVSTVDEGIDKCLKVLGDNDSRIIEFFAQNNGYNEEMIVTYWKEEYQLEITLEDVKEMLEWYAILRMGRQMKELFVENPDSACHFTAEL